MLKFSLIVAAFSFLALAGTSFAQSGNHEDNLIVNSNFEVMDTDGRPQDWEISHPNFLERNETRIEVITEDAQTFYRVNKSAATGPQLGEQRFDIPEGTENLRISAKIRGNAITRGSDHWHLPGIGITFFYGDSDSESKTGEVSKWILIPTGDSEWREYESIVPVREAALRGGLSIIGLGWTGSADFSEIIVEALE